MAGRGRAPSGKPTKAQRVAEAVAHAVGAGRAVALKTVDFNDPNRPKTCLEVDFPILPVNQVATIEGNAGKPIYQMSKWWARRHSSVFRSLLLSAAMKAPDDPSQAAKAVWDVYYANHQKEGSFNHLKVADIFMGGGTTVVEGSRLGMQMFGNDLNPVAWFVVKTELAEVTQEEVKALLDDIEAEVKPQVMPFYACRGPHGERGKWIRKSPETVMPEDFDPLSLKPGERKDYHYEGPEIIYVFWSKHGPCQVTGCGHRTPIMSSPVIAVKTLSVTAWAFECAECHAPFDIEEFEVRMAPDVPLALVPGERAFAVRNKDGSVTCPMCQKVQGFGVLPAEKKRVPLALLVHPHWLAGAASRDASGQPFGGSVTDDSESTARWHAERASTIRLLEVRGLVEKKTVDDDGKESVERMLPEEVTCPETGATFPTAMATVPKQSNYACAACGTVQDVLETVRASGTTGPVAPYVIQAYSPVRDRANVPYGGRYLIPADDLRAEDAAHREWEARKETDLARYWPRSELPYGFMTHLNNGGLPNHGFTHWWTMFNPRQLLMNSLLLKAIVEVGGDRHAQSAREVVLASFMNYVRNQSMLSFWHRTRDHFAPALSNDNFHSKDTSIEVGAFAPVGYGPWRSCTSGLNEAIDWSGDPWELVAKPPSNTGGTKSDKVYPHDPLISKNADIRCGSATDLASIAPSTVDLCITDPPFGGLLHYSELADFLYVWLRLALKDRYPDQFDAMYTPKTLEAVANRARHPDDADEYYQRLLTASWAEANRILKPGGLLAFTFHHSKDEPWVAVLESLFNAGFYLEATWPIRSDETKGEGSKPGTFGAQKIEFDIVHVCRKRLDDPTPVSWAKMRREVLQDVRALKQMLEHHQKSGLADADLQVIRIGKALEYYSRHYGKVFVDDGRSMSVLEAIVGIKQLVDEETGFVKDPPPNNAEPFTRQFLRLFDGKTQLPRSDMQKFLRGTSIAPSDFEARGWCAEERKEYRITSPLDIARAWQGKHRRGMASDYDQAMFLIGACFESSGINATETLANDQFKPHAALGSLLDWFVIRGATPETRIAAARAQTILRSWRGKNEKQPVQTSFGFDDQETP